MTRSDELTKLRAQLADAEAELEAWRAYDSVDSTTLELPARRLRAQLKLRNLGTAKVALALYNCPRPLSVAMLAELVPARQERRGQERHDINYFAVEICYLRSAIGYPAVKTIWGWGYEMTPEGRATIKQALSEMA
jgi:hypothetical protein